ncbi:hypothetical protein HDF18_09155 [Mucilaginibacter sp. X5P1]|uniref:hypothetical protein n=1 Tax=Mucilaginibacter sp. X5P1 TaxID=2723088 RepID=UPI0016115E89|nr:hypothetical protein [Mucilaginibacter sp. X5P1]MBB6137830.1 hypothetical protein [Mucilaginibacter sp. X5P1]
MDAAAVVEAAANEYVSYDGDDSGNAGNGDGAAADLAGAVDPADVAAAATVLLCPPLQTANQQLIAMQ